MVERHGIAYHEKELGQLFCDRSAKLIVQMLVDECRQAGVRIEVDCKVTEVERHGDGFTLESNRGPVTWAGSISNGPGPPPVMPQDRRFELKLIYLTAG